MFGFKNKRCSTGYLQMRFLPMFRNSGSDHLTKKCAG